MRKIRALIADDESLARNRLKRLLQIVDEMEIVGECKNGEETIQAVRELSPDVLFLDIQMPGMDGFQVLESLVSGKLPYIVFVTAYDQYVLKAFEVFALDYLLKPFNEERLLRSVRRVQDRLDVQERVELSEKIQSLLEEIQSRPEYSRRLIVRNQKGSELVNVEEIFWIQAEKKRCRIHLQKESHLLSQSLQELEQSLDPQMFVRIHRARIVNRNFIKQIQQGGRSNEPYVVLMNGTRLAIGRTFHHTILSTLLR